ncbi:MAG: TerB family tellurite resistance protein [Planctomycetes bacterium]|nr:TerB family tellurite resistance protein [Planctomycetota bacterium]
MTQPKVIDGTFGVRLTVPDGWRQVQDEVLAAVWRAPDGALVLVSHLPEQVIVDPALLDDYRLDLRLIAAARGGGLLACELHPTLGVVGITKEPATDGPGLVVVGRALVPTSQGHLAVSVVATGGAEALARDAGRDPASGADPYGFQPEPAAARAGFAPAAWPERLLLALPTDAPEHDAASPDHPLSRVRAALEALRVGARRLEPEPVAPSRRVVLDALAFDLPPGFLAADQGRLKHGQLFRRVTFEKRVTFLTVCRQPEHPEAGRSVEAAGRLVQQHVAWAQARLLQGPRLEATTLGGKAGVFAEHEAAIGGPVGGPVGGHETYSASFLLPWEDHALEVTCFGERDDWARARRNLDAVVGSARSATKPSMVPDTTRIAGEVTPAGRRRIYRILCHLAHCDGEVDPREREALEAQRQQLLLDQAEAAALEAEGARGEKLDLSKNPAEQRLLLDAMLEVVAADGCLDHNEQRRVMEIAQLAGIPRQAVSERLLDLLAGGGAPPPPAP